MIRINLLPQAKKAVRAAAPSTPADVQSWLIGYAVASLVFIGGLVGIYMMYAGELEEEQAQNQALTTQIQQLRSQSTQLDDVRARLAQSQRLEEVVDELQRARTGPARVMMELSQLISPPPNGGPTIDPEELEEMRRENPLAGFNRSWDPRRLHISQFQETDNACTIKGLGRTNEDVAEFLRRLALSELFDQVTLQKTQATTSEGLPFISFDISCVVSY